MFLVGVAFLSLTSCSLNSRSIITPDACVSVFSAQQDHCLSASVGLLFAGVGKQGEYGGGPQCSFLSNHRALCSLRGGFLHLLMRASESGISDSTKAGIDSLTGFGE